MKAITRLLILSTLAFPRLAAAAEWIALPAAGSSDQYFYDRSKLTIKDDEITYWKKVVFKVPQPIHGREAASGLLRERIHCENHTARLVSYLYYSATGETIDYVAQDESDPTPIIPDTVGDAFERVLCPMVWHKQEEARLKAEQKATSAELASGKKDEVKPDARPAKPAAVVVPAPVPPKAPVAPTVTIQRKLQPNEVPPDSTPVMPIPLPQIMEQLY